MNTASEIFEHALQHHNVNLQNHNLRIETVSDKGPFKLCRLVGVGIKEMTFRRKNAGNKRTDVYVTVHSENDQEFMSIHRKLPNVEAQEFEYIHCNSASKAKQVSIAWHRFLISQNRDVTRLDFEGDLAKHHRAISCHVNNGEVAVQ